MLKKVTVLAILCLGFAGAAFAVTSSDPSIVIHDTGWGIRGERNTVLLLETTTTALGTALTDCGVTYDYYYTDGNFASLDLSPYEHVFLGMDGGLVTAGSIQNAANFANAGGKFHIYGGTCWQEYATAMNQYLVANQVNNYCWQTVNGQPHSTVVDPNHCLAAGLPATYNYADISASYYQLRVTDGGIWTAAMNGDSWPHLFSKTIGAGLFDACINSSYAWYYSNPNDYNWLKTVVCNMLNCGGPVATEETTWGAVKGLYR